MELTDKLAELSVSEKDATEQKEDAAPPKERRPHLSEEERRKIWEEKQAKKEVLEKGIAGKVKWYSVRAKYGFIEREDGKEDVFVHQSVISASPMQKQYLRTLDNDEPVEFDVVKGDKGPEAANVTGPKGAEVKGSRFYFLLLHRPRRNQNKRETKSDGESNEKAKKQQKKGKRSNRRRAPRKLPTDAKSAGEESESEEPKAEGEEADAAPARRRGSAKGSTKTKLPSPTASGDASLGAQSAPSAAVH